MSAINTDENGKPVFDASKRIRATFGNNVSKNVEAGAFSRLAQAGAGATRSPVNGANDVMNDGNGMVDIRENITAQIIHTNPRPVDTGINNNGVNSIMSEVSVRTQLNNNVFDYSHVVNKAPAKARKFFGIMPNASETSIKDSLMGLTATVGTSTASRIVINSAVLNNKKLDTKDRIIGSVVTSGVTSLVNTGLSVNHEEFDKVFEVNGLTKEDQKLASKVATTEALKYNVIRDTATKFVPAVTKTVLDKVVPEKVKESLPYQLATGFNALSTVSGALFGIGYSKSVIKANVKNDAKLTNNSDMSRKEYVKVMAQNATRNGLASQINPDLYVSGVMTIVDSIRKVVSFTKSKEVAPVVTKEKVVTPVKKAAADVAKKQVPTAKPVNKPAVKKVTK